MNNDFKEQQSKLAAEFTRFCNCPCRFFPPMTEDSPILDAYWDARKRGKKEGFVPMLVVVDDILWECLQMNSDPDCGGMQDSFRPEQAAQDRQDVLATPVMSEQETQKMFAERLQERKEDIQEAGLNWDVEILGEQTRGEANNRFLGYWDYGSPRRTQPLILAEIPVKHPWEVFAYLPFGGWNDCPGTLEQMAAAKYWWERHGAVPAVLTHDVLEFTVPAPVSREQAMPLALEQYSFCADIVDQGVGTVGVLADMLSKSTMWYFWWD